MAEDPWATTPDHAPRDRCDALFNYTVGGPVQREAMIVPDDDGEALRFYIAVAIAWLFVLGTATVLVEEGMKCFSRGPWSCGNILVSCAALFVMLCCLAPGMPAFYGVRVPRLAALPPAYLSDRPSRDRPCLELVVVVNIRKHTSADGGSPIGDLHPISSCPCRAYTRMDPTRYSHLFKTERLQRAAHFRR